MEDGFRVGVRVAILLALDFFPPSGPPKTELHTTNYDGLGESPEASLRFKEEITMKKLHTCELRGASFPSEQLHHFDGLTGKQKTKLIRARGTDAAGIAYNSGGRLHICKGPAHKHRFFVPGDTRVVMGHTRMTTQGDAKYPQNNHPFAGKAGRLNFALAHNGVLYNDKSLRKSKKLPKTRIQTDSYVAVQLLEQQGALTPDSLREMAETVEGSFVFTVLDEKDRLYLVNGDNPLTIWHYPRLVCMSTPPPRPSCSRQ